MNDTVQYIAFLFPVFFIGIWSLILLILARVGGWKRLAVFYGSSRDLSKQQWRMQTIKLGSVRYKNCISIGVGLTSLYLSAPLPFRFGHPRLEIPYSDLTGMEVGDSTTGYVDIGIRRCPEVRLSLLKQLADKIETSSHGIWSYKRSR